MGRHHLVLSISIITLNILSFLAGWKNKDIISNSNLVWIELGLFLARNKQATSNFAQAQLATEAWTGLPRKQRGCFLWSSGDIGWWRPGPFHYKYLVDMTLQILWKKQKRQQHSWVCFLFAFRSLRAEERTGCCRLGLIVCSWDGFIGCLFWRVWVKLFHIFLWILSPLIIIQNVVSASIFFCCLIHTSHHVPIICLYRKA